MLRVFAAAALVAAIAGPALAQDPHGAHAGMPASGHAGMDHSQHHGAAGGAQAVTTTPADGAMLMAPPSTFSATFPHPMMLVSLRIAAEGQPPVEVAVAPAEPAATVSAPLPVLAPATYTLSWMARGADGHEMSGSTGFMVH